MNKMKKVEISELFNQEITIPRYACLTPQYRDMYYFYLEKNIELTYHKKNLLKYLDKERDKFFAEPVEKVVKTKSGIGYSLKVGLLRALFFLSLYACHVTGKDMLIHEETNTANTYALIDYLGEDFDRDGIKEIDTSILKYVDSYSVPTEDPYYKNSNLFYNLQDDVRVLDNISYMVAMDHLGIDVIEIDDIKYSKNGIVNEIHYIDTIDGVPYCKTISTSTIFNDNDEIEEYLKQKVRKLPYEEPVKFDYMITYETKLLDDIPSVYKNKEDGSVTIKEPNKVLTKIKKSFL